MATLSSGFTNLTTRSFSKIPEAQLATTTKFGNAAKTVWKTGLTVDEEIEFIFTPEVNVQLFADDTSQPEELSSGKNTIRVQYPLFYNFIFKEAKIKQINASATFCGT